MYIPWLIVVERIQRENFDEFFLPQKQTRFSAYCEFLAIISDWFGWFGFPIRIDV